MRALLAPNTNSTFGDPLITAGSNVIATPNQTFSKSYSLTLPTYATNPGGTVAYASSSLYTDCQKNYTDNFYSTEAGTAYNKPEDMYLVAFVSMYNANDPSYCEVLNAYKVPLIGWSAGINPVDREINTVDLYPNPANSTSILNSTLVHSGEVSIEVYDMMGHKVADVLNGTQMAGAQAVNINVSNLSNGLYFATITSNGVKAVQKIMVQK